MSEGKAARVADEIRARVRRELGITVSVGVSFNKVFAKLGSDYKKPDATTLISLRNFRALIYPMPAGEMLYVGAHTGAKLREMGILTIGDLADADCGLLHQRLGKNGLMLRRFARGEDTSPVLPMEEDEPIKSVGNSTTPPHDVETMEDLKCIVYLLADSVGARLRQQGLCCGTVSVSARFADLSWASCQGPVRPATNLSGELAEAALKLFQRRFAGRLPLRSVGLCGSALLPEHAPVQLDLLGEQARRESAEALERTLDDLRLRFGRQVIRRGVILKDAAFAAIDPRDDAAPQTIAFAHNAAQPLRCEAK